MIVVGSAVRRAILAMSDIETYSSEIGRAIWTVDEIAFQTGLPTLNAGIEAVGAGVEGLRGFAVPAWEFLRRSQRSAQASKEINDIVVASKKSVRQRGELEIGEGIERIVSEVSQLNGAIAAILGAPKPKSNLGQANTMVRHIDEGTQRNASMVEEPAVAVYSLAHQTEELAQLIDRFDAGASDFTTHEPRTAAPGESISFSSLRTASA
ncbi:Methyl-accepting chemotaxis protein, putative mcpA (plasmid) [Bradyrhizobium guangxiense]